MSAAGSLESVSPSAALPQGRTGKLVGPKSAPCKPSHCEFELSSSAPVPWCACFWSLHCKGRITEIFISCIVSSGRRNYVGTARGASVAVHFRPPTPLKIVFSWLPVWTQATGRPWNILLTDRELSRPEAPLCDWTGCSLWAGGRGILWCFPNSHHQGLAAGFVSCFSISSSWVELSCFFSLALCPLLL